MVKAVIFDLDGTLVDSARDLQAVANQMLSEYELAPYSLDEIKGFIGHGIRNLVELCLRGREERYEAAPGIEDAYQRILELYYAAPAQHSCLFNGVAQLLPELRSRGLKLAVCTNKAEPLAVKLIENLGAAAHFDAIVGSLEGRPRKPDPAAVRLCLDKLSVTPSDAVYVGDSETDEETAINAGLPFVFFTGGYRKKSVDAFQCYSAIDDFTQLKSVLNDLGKRSN